MTKKFENAKKILKRPHFLILIVLIIAMYFLTAEEEWQVTKDGILKYPKDRGTVQFTAIIIEEGGDYTKKKISYKSRDLTIYSLLWLPKSAEKVPAVVIVPGAEVLKEHREDLAKKLVRMGFSAMVLDQRTFGETGGIVPSIREDIESFNNNKEPVQHRFIYDVLRAGDVLRSQPEIDPEKIALIGESMGGRFVIIAGAIDKDIKGIIAISTGGYGFDDANLWNYQKDEVTFLKSLDPDNYVKMISPRKFVSIHSTGDTVVPLKNGEATFKAARLPKRMYTLNGTFHGYNPLMDEYIEKELGEMFK